MITAFVTATGTEVGKTWWAAQTAVALRERGARVAARKPAQSGIEPGATDADVLARATGERPDVVCPPRRWYAPAVAPPMATPERFTVAQLVGEMAPVLPGTDVLLVEGAGGPASPLADDGDNVDFARALAPDVVLVVGDAGLGTINALRLSAGACLAIAPVVLALNRYRDDVPLHATNRRWLEGRYGFTCFVDPATLASHLVEEWIPR